MDVRDVETEARAGEAIEEEVDVEGSGSGEDQEDSMIVIEGQDQDTLPAHELISKLAEALEFKDTCLVDSVPAKVTERVGGFPLSAMAQIHPCHDPFAPLAVSACCICPMTSTSVCVECGVT